jgi:hypothetical protein
MRSAERAETAGTEETAERAGTEDTPAAGDSPSLCGDALGSNNAVSCRTSTVLLSVLGDACCPVVTVGSC